MFKKNIAVLLILCSISYSSVAQVDWVQQTFKDTRVINAHSIETLAKRKLDIRIGHRFGDLGDGWETFYGLENAADIMIGAEYGVSNSLTIGLHRTKGSGPLSQLLNGTVKYRLMKQKISGAPLSITLLGVSSLSTMKKSDDPEALSFFPEFKHRMSHTVQVLFAKKFSSRFSLQLAPGYTHRNLVPIADDNGLFSFAAALRFQLTKVFGIIADCNIPLTEYRLDSNNGFSPAFGIGLEIDTGGHVFQVNFTNASGISENDYIPYTTSSWGDGEFRLGFTVSRLFNL